MIREQELDKILAGIRLDEQPPSQEPERQYYYLKLCQKAVKETSERLGRPLTAHVTTFGCQMNARDSEKLAGVLKQAGYVLVPTEEADFNIYNTCTVRDNADQRVYGRLGHLNSLKKKEPHRKVALCGCMMQESGAVEKILSSYRFVDLIFGTHNLFKFPELLAATLTQEGRIVDIWKETDQIIEDLPTERKYPFKSGINIMFGCNNFCTYCIVPYVRGRERSRSPKDILREIEALAADGVVEIMLLGQNVNSYGKNLDEPISFARLLKEVEQIDGIERIRFMTSHPKDLSDELIETIASSDKICRHLHLPLQTGSSRLLKAMNRHYTKEQYLSLVDRLRDAVPDLSITTDIIIGFPGETKKDVEDTIDVIRKARFDNAFTFLYSKRAGTPAASFPGQVPREEAQASFDRVLGIVQETARQQVKRLSGRTMEALVEETNRQESGLLTGRLSNNTLVHFPGDPSLIGRIVPVYLKEYRGFYFIGEQAEENHG